MGREGKKDYCIKEEKLHKNLFDSSYHYLIKFPQGRISFRGDLYHKSNYNENITLAMASERHKRGQESEQGQLEEYTIVGKKHMGKLKNALVCHKMVNFTSYGPVENSYIEFLPGSTYSTFLGKVEDSSLAGHLGNTVINGAAINSTFILCDDSRLEINGSAKNCIFLGDLSGLSVIGRKVDNLLLDTNDPQPTKNLLSATLNGGVKISSSMLRAYKEGREVSVKSSVGKYTIKVRIDTPTHIGPHQMSDIVHNVKRLLEGTELAKSPEHFRRDLRVVIETLEDHIEKHNKKYGKKYKNSGYASTGDENEVSLNGGDCAVCRIRHKYNV